MIKFTNIQIGRVSNGWIVIGSPKPGTAAAPEDTVLVQDDEDLAGAIAAALVAGKFKAADSPATEAAQVGNLLQGAPATTSLEEWRVRWEEMRLQQYANAHPHKSFV